MMVILGTLASVVIRVVDSKDSARAVTIKTGKETLNKDWLITKAKKNQYCYNIHPNISYGKRVHAILAE